MSNFVAKDTTPSFVLLCKNQQVGAMMGDVDKIFMFEIFKEYRGVRHSEIFLELIEQEARRLGKKKISTQSPTIEPAMVAAFRKCGFYVEKEEKDGNLWFAKDL